MPPSYRARSHAPRGFYSFLAVGVFACAVLLVGTNWALAYGQSRSLSLPPAAPPATGPPAVSVVLTSVQGEFTYSGGGAAGAFGPSPQALNISRNESGTLPLTFSGGSYLDWQVPLTNSNTTTVYINGVSCLTPGATWDGSGTGGAYTVPGNSTVFVNLRFTLPYQNYTGPLEFEFQA